MSIGKTSLPTLPRIPGKAGVFRPEHRYLAIAGLSFLLIAFFIHLVADGERELRDQALRNTAVQHAAGAAARLEAELNSNIFLANGLATYVSREEVMNPADLHSAMRTLTGLGQHIRNIGVAVGYRLTYVYPEEGNQEAIGLYYPDVPEQWVDVQKAIASRSTVVAGPLPLAQGGQGIISRTPVFQEDGTYWGILSLVLNAGSLFRGAGLSSTVEGHHIALRQGTAATSTPTAFFGDPAVFGKDPVIIEMALPGNTWELGLVPVGGWSADHRLINWTETVLVAIAMVICAFLFAFIRNRDQLRVREREISAILNTSREGIVVLDAEDNVLEANTAACAIFSRDISEIRGKPVSRIIDFNSSTDDDFEDFANVHREETDEEAIRATGLCARRGAFPLEIKVGQAKTAGRFLLVCALRDISADLNYERKLIELATIDPLTRAFNRRSFFVQGERAVQLAERHGREISLLLVDADHFKVINDTYGHGAGDTVLAALGSLVRGSIRRTDIFGRIGGEEFALLLPETNGEDANILAGKINEAVRNAQIPTGENETIRFTVSIGVVSTSDNGHDFRSMLQAADRALYRAKRSGRNRYAV